MTAVRQIRLQLVMSDRLPHFGVFHENENAGRWSEKQKRLRNTGWVRGTHFKGKTGLQEEPGVLLIF